MNLIAAGTQGNCNVFTTYEDRYIRNVDIISLGLDNKISFPFRSQWDKIYTRTGLFIIIPRDYLPKNTLLGYIPRGDYFREPITRLSLNIKEHMITFVYWNVSRLW